MKSVFYACALLLAGATTALAQDVCQYSDKSYSIGASIRLGDVLVTCALQESGSYSWFVVPEDGRTTSANCLYGGGEYSHGAMINVRPIRLICGNGRWYKDKEQAN